MLECVLIVIWTMNLSYGDYKWQWFVNLQASLLAQTQSAEEAKQACAAAQAQNEELIRKLGDAEKKVDQLQESVQRFVTKLMNRKHLDIFFVLFIVLHLMSGEPEEATLPISVDSTSSLYYQFFTICGCYLVETTETASVLSWHSLLNFPP